MAFALPRWPKSPHTARVHNGQFGLRTPANPHFEGHSEGPGPGALNPTVTGVSEHLMTNRYAPDVVGSDVLLNNMGRATRRKPERNTRSVWVNGIVSKGSTLTVSDVASNIGPVYNPAYTQTKKQSPRAKFSKAAPDRPAITPYNGRGYSPGPVYYPKRGKQEASNMPNSPRFSFGGKGSAGNRTHFYDLKITEDGLLQNARPSTRDPGSSISPAQYEVSDNSSSRKWKSPSQKFGAAPRFVNNHKFYSPRHRFQGQATQSPGPVYRSQYGTVAHNARKTQNRSSAWK